MQTWQIALVVIVAVVVIGVVWLYLRRTRTTSHGPYLHRQYGYSVWSFRGGRWAMVEDHSAAGCAPGPPPGRPGRFDGENVQVISVPAARG